MSPAAPPPSPAPSRIVSPRDRQLPSTVRVTRNPVSVIRLQAPRKHKRPVWTVVVAAYLVAAPATPAGISGAVLLLPFQVSVLGTPSPPVNPTNLPYNVVATPAPCTCTGGRQTGGRLALVLITGSVIRVELVPGPHVFDLAVAAVLVPLGRRLAVTQPASAGNPATRPRADDPGGCCGLRRRHRRDRRRLALSTDPDRHRAATIPGRSRRPGSHPGDLGRGRDHPRHLVDPPAGLGGPGVEHWHRVGHRRPGRCLHQCPASSLIGPTP
jgi:hypothetical protein